MAADTPQLATADARARLLILELASEDCYGVKEFINSLLDLYPDAAEIERLDHVRRNLATLSDEGLVRLHWEPQCSGDTRASDELTISSEEVAGLPIDALMPYQEPSVDVCDTELTVEAYNRAWTEQNAAPNA